MSETRTPSHRPAHPARPIGRALAVTAALVIAAPAVTAFHAPAPSDGYPTGELAAQEVPNGWAPLIEEAAAENQVPAPVLAAQIEAESAWRTDAVSPVGAQGLSQFMPATWEEYGQGGDPENPEHAIDAQGRMMGDLLRSAQASGIEGDPMDLALAGYNAGFGTVQQHDGIPPYPETQDYVAKIQDRAPIYAQVA